MFHSTRFSILNIAFLGTVTLLLPVGSGTARAQSESFSTSSYFGCALDNTDLYVPTFNTKLGTLDSIDITLTLNLTPDISVINTGSTPVAFTNASISLPVEISALGTFNFETTLTASHSGTAKPGETTFTLGTHSVTDVETIDTSDFASWENSSAKDVGFTATKGDPTFAGTAQGDGLFFGGSDYQLAKITVQYNYASSALAAPEPKGMYLTAIVGLAMAAILIGRGLLPSES